MSYQTREEWLRAAVAEMTPWLAEKDMKLPKVQVAVGFAKYAKSNAIGQCWSTSCTEDGTSHIFVCPRLNDAVQVLSVLLHELVHAAVGTEAGHRGPFVKGVRALGLVGKPTSTYAEEGSELHNRLVLLSQTLGTYPHSMLTIPMRKRPPGGGWLKLTSQKDESYILRISPKALKEGGLPTDPWGEKMLLPEDYEPELETADV